MVWFRFLQVSEVHGGVLESCTVFIIFVVKAVVTIAETKQQKKPVGSGQTSAKNSFLLLFSKVNACYRFPKARSTNFVIKRAASA